VEDSLKCLHCGYEYRMSVDPKREVTERVCPQCKSNSVRKLPQPKE
jgi:predicted Zn-ribbon and HTH transcriptional regulator